MTTNARDEKWSEWHKHDGKNVPLDDRTKFEYRMRGGTELVAMDKASDYAPGFIHKDCASDIIAYRYKIKEPESKVMKRGRTEAETLALNGWKVGDILEGDEGNGPDRILITAIGEDRFTCKWDYKCTGEYQRESGNTTLSCREWRKVGYRAGLDQPEVTPEEDEAWQAKERELAWNNERQGRAIKKQLGELDELSGCGHKYSAYFKDVRHIEYIDVYRTVDLFECEKHGHPISHAAKKLLLSGSRTGGKDVEEDVREAIDSLYRWLEMREEDKRAL